MRHIEKRTHMLAKLGDHLKAQRLTVFRETPSEFAERLAAFGAGQATGASVEAMESGSGDVSIELWMSAWQAMQVIDAVVKATKSDAALFLASTKFAPGIEAEMARELNKNGDKS